MNPLGSTVLLYRGLEILPGEDVDAGSLGIDYSQDPLMALSYTRSYVETPNGFVFDKSLFIKKGRLYVVITDPSELGKKTTHNGIEEGDLVISLKPNTQFSDVREVALGEVEKILKWEGRRDKIRDRFNDEISNPCYMGELHRLFKKLARNIFPDYF